MAILALQTGSYYACRASRVVYAMVTERSLDIRAILNQIQRTEVGTALKGRLQQFDTHNSRYLAKYTVGIETSYLARGQSNIFGDVTEGEENSEFFESTPTTVFVWHATWIKDGAGMPQMSVKTAQLDVQEILNWNGTRSIFLSKGRDCNATTFLEEEVTHLTGTLNKAEYHSKKWNKAFVKCAKTTLPENLKGIVMKESDTSYEISLQGDIIQNMLNTMMRIQRMGEAKKHFDFKVSLKTSHSDQ